jgi:hypothetical protein
MIKRDYLFEQLEEKWTRLPWWLKSKIVLMIMAATWEGRLAYWWLHVTHLPGML